MVCFLVLLCLPHHSAPTPHSINAFLWETSAINNIHTIVATVPSIAGQAVTATMEFVRSFRRPSPSPPFRIQQTAFAGLISQLRALTMGIRLVVLSTATGGYYLVQLVVMTVSADVKNDAVAIKSIIAVLDAKLTTVTAITKAG